MVIKGTNGPYIYVQIGATVRETTPVFTAYRV